LRKIAGWGLLRHRVQQIGELAIMEIERRRWCAELSTRITKAVRMFVIMKRYRRNSAVLKQKRDKEVIIPERKISDWKDHGGNNRNMARENSRIVTPNESVLDDNRISTCAQRSLKTLIMAGAHVGDLKPEWVQYLWEKEPEKFLKKIPHYRYMLLSPDMVHSGGLYFTKFTQNKSGTPGKAEQPTSSQQESVPTTHLDNAPAPGDDDEFLQPADSVSIMRRILNNQSRIEKELNNKLKSVELEVAKMNMSLAVSSNSHRLLHEGSKPNHF